MHFLSKSQVQNCANIENEDNTWFDGGESNLKSGPEPCSTVMMKKARLVEQHLASTLLLAAVAQLVVVSALSLAPCDMLLDPVRAVQ